MTVAPPLCAAAVVPLTPLVTPVSSLPDIPVYEQWYEVSEEEFFNPGAAVLLSIITLGGASVYFEYEIARRAESLIITTGGKEKRVNSSKKPPISNYKEIVLIVNIIAIALAWFSVGALFIITWIPGIWTLLLHQNALEYLIDIDK